MQVGITLGRLLLASWFLALSARLALPLPFTPVPIALHPTIAVCLGYLLGPVQGTASVLLYLVQGALGLPCFMGGASGLAWLAGPTGGYLIGFLPAAAWAGGLAFCFPRNGLGTFSALLLGHLPIYLFGLLQLSLLAGWNGTLWVLGCFPFLPGCLLKSLLLGALIVRRRTLMIPFASFR